jgi:hypothetical protein
MECLDRVSYLDAWNAGWILSSGADCRGKGCRKRRSLQEVKVITALSSVGSNPYNHSRDLSLPSFLIFLIFSPLTLSPPSSTLLHVPFLL